MLRARSQERRIAVEAILSISIFHKAISSRLTSIAKAVEEQNSAEKVRKKRRAIVKRVAACSRDRFGYP